MFIKLVTSNSSDKYTNYQILVMHSMSHDHKPDKARHWLAKHRS